MGGGRHSDRQHEESDGDGEHAIAERFQAGRPEAEGTPGLAVFGHDVIVPTCAVNCSDDDAFQNRREGVVIIAASIFVRICSLGRLNISKLSLLETSNNTES